MGAFLSLAGEQEDEIASEQLRSLRRLLLLTLAIESWVALSYLPYSERPGFFGALAAALGLCVLLGWRDRFALAAVLAALGLELVVVASAFPENANHQFLAIVWLALLALGGAGIARLEGRAREPAAAVQGIRWIVAAGLAWSGFMKLWYGYWLSAEFLSWRIALDPDFARVFAPLLPAAELARLTALVPEAGAGPFRADAPLLVGASNLTWLAELVLPLGLFFERTRRAALVLALALIFVIELGALELFFGGLMLGGLLLFAARDRLAPLLPWIGAVYLLRLLWPELVPLLAEGSGGEALGLLGPIHGEGVRP